MFIYTWLISCEINQQLVRSIFIIEIINTLVHCKIDLVVSLIYI